MPDETPQDDQDNPEDAAQETPEDASEPEAPPEAAADSSETEASEESPQEHGDSGQAPAEPVTAASISPFLPPQFDVSDLPKGQGEQLEMLGDVELDVQIELGRTSLLVEDVLKLGAGAVVELDKLAGDPVDIYVNGRHVARGEVLVLNDNFCVRVSEILESVGETDARADAG